MAEEPIRIVPYDDSWPERFEAERKLLARIIRPWVSGGIHHIGSTAVPGLAAKPIIDILVGVVGLEQSRAAFGPLAGLEYKYAPYRADQEHWFCKPDPLRRTHHLHLVPVTSQRYRDDLVFRDRLRADEELAREYERLKRELAARFEHDREAYTEAKAAFVERVLRGRG